MEGTSEQKPAASTEVLAAPLADVVVDPTLLAAMVTTAPTVLTPATAPEPEAGALSVGAVDGGTAVILTAPTASTAEATGLPGQAPVPTPGTAAAPEEAVLQTATAAAANALALADPTVATSGGPGPTGPSSTNAGLTNAGSTNAGLNSTGPVGAGSAGLVGTGVAAAGTGLAGAGAGAAGAGSSVTGAGAGGAALAGAGVAGAGVTGAGPGGPGATNAAPTTAGTPTGLTGQPNAGIADPTLATAALTSTAGGPSGPGGTEPDGTTSGSASPIPSVQTNSSTPTATPTTPAVDPVAVALAGVYGNPSPVPTADRVTVPNATGVTGGTGPTGAIDAAVGIGPAGPMVANDAPDSGSNPNPDGTSPAFTLAPDTAEATVTTSPNPTTTPIATGVPAPGTVGAAGGVAAAGLTGVTGPTAAAATGSSERARTSEITDQVAAQIGRQLQGARTLRDGTHHTVLKLSPEHLGEVTITLDVRAGGVRLELAAGTQALAALQADLGQLRDDLAGSGLDLSDVTLTSQGSGPGGNNQATGRDRWQEPTPRGLPGDGSSGTAAPSEEYVGRAASRPADGSLDVLA